MNEEEDPRWMGGAGWERDEGEIGVGAGCRKTSTRESRVVTEIRLGSLSYLSCIRSV